MRKPRGGHGGTLRVVHRYMEATHPGREHVLSATCWCQPKVNRILARMRFRRRGRA